ncbi:MAG: ion transporter, partial [Lachnospiraceae bacterium]|nr:ion transporter [Lachnospiraceae bacterium]
MVSVGVIDEPVNRAYDIISTLCLLCNLSAAILATYQGFQVKHGLLLREVERWTVLFFAIDYVLRLLTAKELYTGKTEEGALCAYILSFSGIIDLLSFLPYYLPIFFPAGAAVFRMFRVIRIFRLFRINNYYDSLNVITEVLESKRQQLLSSVFIICILMVASSLCMYSVEHNAQPRVFTDAFSGIWWAASTLLTVGYGDIYPITPLGKLLGIGITFLGVGMVAIPTGIISAGFVEQYQRLKRIGDYGGGSGIHFIHFFLEKKDAWCEKAIKELELPGDLRIVVLKRKNQVIVPRGDVRMHAGDELVLGAEALRDESPLDLTEVVLHEDHPWV